MSSTNPSSGPSAATITLATVGIITTGLLGYALYFDHRRRTDPGFRKALKKESKRTAKAVKAAEQEGAKRDRKAIQSMVNDALEEGFPTTAEEKEQLFMTEVGQGEAMCNDPSLHKEAALCFWKALRVYPQPRELMTIYDKTVPKPVLDLIAEMVAYDSTISDSGSASSSTGGVE